MRPTRSIPSMAGKETDHLRRSSQVSRPTAEPTEAEGAGVRAVGLGASEVRSTPAGPVGSPGKAIFCSLIARYGRERSMLGTTLVRAGSTEVTELKKLKRGREQSRWGGRPDEGKVVSFCGRMGPPPLLQTKLGTESQNTENFNLKTANEQWSFRTCS